MELQVQVAALLARSLTNGPGLRSVLWVQGCPMRCPGCFNPGFQDPAGGTALALAAVAPRLLEPAETEGVTFSGGEPFAQAEALAVLAAACQKAGKGVLIFTGYEYADDLRERRESHCQALLAACDLLVAGPYRHERGPGANPLLASANQQLVFLSDRYRGWDFGVHRRRIEYRISHGGVEVTGFPAAKPHL